MNTDDFMAYLGDFPAGYVQYGHATEFCNIWLQYYNMTESDLFTAAIYYQFNEGDFPWEYSTGAGSKIQNTTIDIDYAGRQWTY